MLTCLELLLLLFEYASGSICCLRIYTLGELTFPYETSIGDLAVVLLFSTHSFISFLRSLFEWARASIFDLKLSTFSFVSPAT